jgi:hypothetical protein
VFKIGRKRNILVAKTQVKLAEIITFRLASKPLAMNINRYFL